MTTSEEQTARPPLTFRSEALRDYRYRRAELAAPAYVEPRRLAWLWIVVVVLSGATAALVRHILMLLAAGSAAAF